MCWTYKTFKTQEAMDRWIARHKHRYQIKTIFVNNGFGVDYRPLIKINV